MFYVCVSFIINKFIHNKILHLILEFCLSFDVVLCCYDDVIVTECNSRAAALMIKIDTNNLNAFSNDDLLHTI